MEDLPFHHVGFSKSRITWMSPSQPLPMEPKTYEFVVSDGKHRVWAPLD